MGVTARGARLAAIASAPTVIIQGGSWRDQAACAGLPGELFWEAEHFAEAKRVCRGCPVEAKCLEYALKRREAEGIWGGTTPEERARLLGVRRLGY